MKNLPTKESCEKEAYYLWRQLSVQLPIPTDGKKYKSALGSPDHHMGEQSSLTEPAAVSYQQETARLKSLYFNRKKADHNLHKRDSWAIKLWSNQGKHPWWQ